METNPIISNNVNFGMALFMPDKSQIQKKMGYYAAEEAEKARGTLAALAKDVDIYVKPKHSHLKVYTKYDYFEYIVTDAGKNIFDRMIERLNFRLRKNVYVSPYGIPLSTRLIDSIRETTQDLKSILGKS